MPKMPSGNYLKITTDKFQMTNKFEAPIGKAPNDKFQIPNKIQITNKSQITSTKFQINSNDQIRMTKTLSSCKSSNPANPDTDRGKKHQ